MTKKRRKQRSTQQRGEQEFRKLEGSKIPAHLIKDSEIQIEGQITASCHGIYHVDLTNGMKALATARKLDAYLRVSLLDGDKVVVSIPPASLSANEDKIRGRIIWRCRD